MKLLGLTDKGLLRNANQDDYCFKALSDTAAFAVVCDGMGGASSGNVASRIAVDSISDSVSKAYRPGLTPSAAENIMRSALFSANLSIYRTAKENPEMKGMGTTVVMVMIENGNGYILHVGDSRAYLFKKGKLTQLTVDHSMVQSLVDSGQITKEEAQNHPKKNIITRALGVEKEVNPDLDLFTFSEGEVLLLCTDGLTNFVAPEVIEEQLQTVDENVASRLIALANDGGGGDNITAVVITC